MSRVQYWLLIYINTGFTLSKSSSAIVSHWLNSVCRAAIIALYRPFLHETPDGVPDNEQDSWKAVAKSKLRTAAAHATHAINCMMAEDLIKFAQTISYVLEAMEYGDAANQLLITQGAHYQPTDSNPSTGNGIIQVVIW